ncbi:uncharacterized protein LOC143177330 [Calliopsis andreniformis]|uniref:uncharacterized protein LOC143177330 n=1 Tax=Calliopsis andreniformis TaxID=337506 RepID=UPI003FCE71E6
MFLSGKNEGIMLTSTVMLMFILISVSFAHEEDITSQVLHFFLSKESQDNRGYVVQCRATNFLKGYLGHVNVFAFLDPSWYYSYRQAIMLELLKKRLAKSGFRDILFFVVTPPSSLPEDDAENNIEIKAWKEISKNILQPEYFWNSEETPFNEVSKNNDKGIIFLQDTPELGIWQHFRGSKDEVVIIDRCGKLTYQVIIPWSILYFPYVKAAILSTYKEMPCGPCDTQPLPISTSMNYLEHIFQKINPDNKDSDKNLDFQTEQTPMIESQTVTTSSEKLRGTEANKYASTVVSLDMNVTTDEITISDKTVTDTLPVETETFRTHSLIDKIYQVTKTASTEDTEKDEGVNTTSMIDETETTTAVSVEHEQTQISPAFSEVEIIQNYKDLQGSTSSNDPGSVNNQKIVNEDIENKESLPLRIIMYAPHLHKEGEQLKQYTHLVLKARNPDYHDHFHSMSKVYEEQTLENKKINKYINEANETPGVYGEIYDYWRTIEEDELNNKNENVEFVDYDNLVVAETETNIDNIFDIESSAVTSSDMDDTIDSDTKLDEDSTEFAQRKLVEHYRKLLPWIYYIL